MLDPPYNPKLRMPPYLAATSLNPKPQIPEPQKAPKSPNPRTRGLRTCRVNRPKPCTLSLNHVIPAALGTSQGFCVSELLTDLDYRIGAPRNPCQTLTSLNPTLKAKRLQAPPQPLPVAAVGRKASEQGIQPPKASNVEPLTDFSV